jgi:hypothetical protein
VRTTLEQKNKRAVPPVFGCRHRRSQVAARHHRTMIGEQHRAMIDANRVIVSAMLSSPGLAHGTSATRPTRMTHAA